jgi:hypothetical protein
MIIKPAAGPVFRDCFIVYVNNGPGIIAPENATASADKNKIVMVASF